jgi:ATP-dependent helicase/nuclease subunit A
MIPHRVTKAPERRRPRKRSDRTTGEALINPQEVAKRWEIRTAQWARIRETPHHLTPTTLGKRVTSAIRETTPVRQDAAIGRLAGVVAHRLLERWDYSQDPSWLCAQVAITVQATLGPDDQSHARAVAESVNDLLVTFSNSEAYERLRSSQILGREVPLIMPWGERQVMEGVIDLIYRLDGELWIVDYKTDTISADQAAARAEQYRTQSEVYKTAARQSLGVDLVRFHCLFLRCATAVEL